MTTARRLLFVLVGVLIGVGGAVWLAGPLTGARAGSTDRFEDYVMCTGAVSIGNGRIQTDGVWLLDYRAGKLLGTVIDRHSGKIIDFASVDLVAEFEIPPRTNVHFLMTTGQVTSGQAVLYVAETTTGRFGVYSMGSNQNGTPGMQIRRHDMILFRKGATPPAEGK